MKSPPNSFTLFGNKWSVKFVDPRKQGVFKRPNPRMVGLTVARRYAGERVIYIHPKWRTDWSVFAHELLHALSFEMDIHQNVRGYGKWNNKKHHQLIEELSDPLGVFLKENLVKPPKIRKPLPKQKPKVIPNKKKAARKPKYPTIFPLGWDGVTP